MGLFVKYYYRVSGNDFGGKFNTYHQQADGYFKDMDSWKEFSKEMKAVVTEMYEVTRKMDFYGNWTDA